MMLCVVLSNILLLQGTCEKEAHIHQCPELMDGAVMALLLPLGAQTNWRGICRDRDTGRRPAWEVRDISEMQKLAD